MKIVYCKDSLETGAGMERVLCTKANYLADVLNHEVHIVLQQSSEKRFFDFSDKIRFHSLNIAAVNRNPLHFLFGSKAHHQYRKKLTEKLNEIKPDITISMFGPEYDFLYKINDGSKKVLEFHFSKNYLTHLVEGLPDTRTKLLKKLWVWFLQSREQYFAKKYKHIVLLTEKDKKLWGGDRRFTVIPNPLSFVSREHAGLEDKRIVAMGRFIAQKGFDLLIQAFYMISGDCPDWKVFIFGEGQDREFLQRQINRLSLQDRIFLQDPVTNVEQEFLNASVFVFPSRYEGFGLVLTEAMTCGVPSVAFDCECGPSEIIEDGVDGLLAEANNVVDLSEKLKELILNTPRRKQMGYNAGMNVMRFERSRIMNLWQNFFNGLIYS